MISPRKISMDILYMNIFLQPGCSSVFENQLLFFFFFISTRAHDRSARFTQRNQAETVICSAVVTNTSSRLDSFTTFSSQQSPTRLIVDLSDVWELYFWPGSRVCVCARCFSSSWVCVSVRACVCVRACMCVHELNRCSPLPLASGVWECFHHSLSLSSTANSPARCNDSNSYNVHSYFNTFLVSARRVPSEQRQTQRHLRLLYVKKGQKRKKKKRVPDHRCYLQLEFRLICLHDF